MTPNLDAHAPQPERPAAPGSALVDGVLRLHDWGLIRAAGADARSFLQGQLTQDVLHLPPGQARLAGYCSPKGRLLASFVVWPQADDQLLLACSADLLPAVLKRLSMYVLRAQCKLSDASAELVLWGAVGPTAVQALGDSTISAWQLAKADGDQTVLRLPDALVDGLPVPRCLVCAPLTAVAPVGPVLDPAAWLALEARSGVPRIVAATSEQFVPQMINLELVGGVDFQKGCYPGQEVVARSQYRGTLKRRAFAVAADAAMQPAQEIFHSADPDQPAGMVVLAGSLGQGRFDGLAELKLQALGSGSLHLGSAQGPVLHPQDLPYPVPLESV
ncbi:MAG: folate-binding protein YgfZ [Rubrivivax sp.]|nr:folate-binding protein YgfZ [Rubrivivax sp.]